MVHSAWILQEIRTATAENKRSRSHISGIGSVNSLRSFQAVMKNKNIISCAADWQQIRGQYPAREESPREGQPAAADRKQDLISVSAKKNNLKNEISADFRQFRNFRNGFAMLKAVRAIQPGSYTLKAMKRC